MPVAPVNETDMVLLPKGLKALQQMAKEVGWAYYHELFNAPR